MQQQFENPYFVSPDFMYNQMMQNQQQQEVQQKMVDLDTSKLPNVEKVKEAEINVFKDYADKLNSQPKKPVETQEVNMVNIETNDDQLFKALSNYRNLSDNNLREIIGNNFRYILQQIFDPAPDNPYRSYVHVFADPRIIQIMNEIVYRSQLTDTEKIYCNKLVYDYIIYSNGIDNGHNEATVGSLRTFASIVNRDVILQLLSFEAFDENTANDIAVASRSSLDQRRNVKRVNKCIMGLPNNVVTEELITAIYYTLFKSATAIIEGIMFDVIDLIELPESKRESYALINLALLSILNNLEDSKLFGVLLNYSQDRQMLFSDKPVRFNLRSFAPQDYPRLDSAINRLDMTNGSPMIY